MLSCFFTGHRSAPFDTFLISETGNVIIDLITKEGVTDFYTGGAIGWDTICARLVLTQKEKYPQIKLNLILPCPPEQQILKWNDKQKEEYNMILKQADHTEIVSDNYTADCMKKRNARLVELGDICICYYNENDFRSGTGQTVRMAQKANKTIFYLYTTIKIT